MGAAAPRIFCVGRGEARAVAQGDKAMIGRANGVFKILKNAKPVL